MKVLHCKVNSPRALDRARAGLQHVLLQYWDMMMPLESFSVSTFYSLYSSRDISWFGGHVSRWVCSSAFFNVEDKQAG